MGSNAATKVENLAPCCHSLQSQGVCDVVGTGEVPGRQLKQMARAHLVFIEFCRILRAERARVEIGQIIRAAG